MIKNFFKTICLGLTCITCALGASACNPSDSGGKQGKMTEEEWRQAFADSYGAESYTAEITAYGETFIQKYDTVNDVYSLFSEEAREYYYFNDNFSDKDGYKYCIIERIRKNSFPNLKHYNNEKDYEKERNKLLYEEVYNNENFGLVHMGFYYTASYIVVSTPVTTNDNTVGKIIDLYKYFDYDEGTGIYSGNFKYGETQFAISYTFADGKIRTFDIVDKDNKEPIHTKITDYNSTVATLPPDIVENINTVKDLLSNS